MKSQLAISHLVRHFLLFAFTVLFLLTLVRAGLNLWQLNHVDDVQTLIRSFLQGIRFDIATVGMLMIVPIVLVPIFAMFNVTVAIARLFSPLWLVFALLLVLALELITPYFLHNGSIRPDVAAIQNLQGLDAVIAAVSGQFLIPALLGTFLLIMLLYAFWARMETNRFLRFPVRKFPAVLLSIVGVVVCILAIRSNFDPATPGLGPDAALISTDQVVNEITLNSTFKTLHNVYASSDALQSLLKMPDLGAVTGFLPANFSQSN